MNDNSAIMCVMVVLTVFLLEALLPWYLPGIEVQVEIWLFSQGLILFLSAIILAVLIPRMGGSSHSGNSEMNPDDLVPSDRIDPDQIIGAAVHELRSPLNRLQLKVERQFDDVNEVMADVEDLTRTLDNIEAVFRGDPVNPRWISVPLFVKRFIVDSRPDLVDSIQCQMSYTWIWCDVESFSTALNNVIANALEAYGNKAEASVDVSSPVTLDFHYEGPELCVTVSDQAGGIDPELYQTLNSDTQTSQSGGMGLGLLITKRIIDEHDGRMLLETDESGTQVTFTLPLPLADEGRPAPLHKDSDRT